FQAEDGIRDFHVTGVQTCALPIWTLRAGSAVCSIRSACALCPGTAGGADADVGHDLLLNKKVAEDRGVVEVYDAGIFPLYRNTRSEEHTSELSHVKISYAVFCLKK